MKSIFAALFALVLAASHAAAKDTIVVVLDASGSMTDKVKVKGGTMTRMNVAKESLKRVLPNIQGDVDLGLVVFSASNIPRDDEWIYPVGPIVRQKLIAAIDKPEPNGGTPLGDYIKVGADKLLDRRQKSGNSGRYRLILVTDGENTEGSDPESRLADVKRKGIQVDLIGLGVSDHTLAKMVTAMPTPGTYQSAQNADQLVEAVTKATKEAPVTASGGIDPVIFEEIAPLADNVSALMIKVLSTHNNTPIGEPDPVISVSVDQGGNVQVQNNPPPTVPGTNYTAMILIIGVVVVVVLAILIKGMNP